MMIPFVLVGGFLVFALGLLLITTIQYPPTIVLLIFQKPHYLLYLLLPYVFEVVWFKMTIRGYACDYEANNVEFRVTRRGKPVMNVIYKNAVSVEYKPMKFLWVEQGFHVTIKMKSHSLYFDYVVPHAMRFHEENFAFELIRRKIGEQDAK